jgi:hypothetical protein
LIDNDRPRLQYIVRDGNEIAVKLRNID